ncbi:cytochrome c-type biogenesis protein [Alteromonas sp. C1M14]|uniref:cytochrome c-type biogenesis protein n=1 Tax=Alteromonas sp. C1M14 TaxID=2841567 RepID=UPI001C080537|nr:cytochrome c-type biogenesis protein [Alteromonas sp. C1M14]MBU2977822.1 cytochrome c-type biogenesis protein CcmH [Alteromonas sp. C1M14]
MMKNIFLLLVLTLGLYEPALAVEDSYAFADPAQRVAFLELTAVLRCPMCQNQNIADSDAMIAHDMRRKVYSLLKEGKTKQEVIAYMKDRYGDFVYYKPPVTFATIWLWALPVIFIVSLMYFVIRRRSQPPEQDIDAKLKQAEAMLKQDDS